MESVYVVENSVKAKEKIDELASQGYTRDEIYVIDHQKKATDQLSDKLHVNEVGLKEEGITEKVANIFRSRGDELRSQFESLGLTKMEAERYEEELDKGHIVIVAKR